ncbi:hypothetical protein SKAU_G00079830 [Synaphobranchus kaupii]|uniref:ALMS motif domain-containing protein n=1 Tax=Synaphobranchus kaupii TaxID=118154 RepID=A0A9Q1FUK7_SYNKA|nr:hypothetical protein SKAU_G00079830 [Synaphobranchus kaupii]
MHLLLNLLSQSDVRGRAAAHPRAPKPPLARSRLGILEIIEQHELSAIQEVETPINASLATVGEESVEVPCSLTEEAGVLEGLSRAEGGQASTEGECSSGSSTVTSRSSRLSWRERLQRESGSSPEPGAGKASGLLQHASDNGRGALTHPGLTVPDFKAREEGRVYLPGTEERYCVPSEQTPADPESLSSFTISTGSFSTNEPDFSSTAMDASLLSADAAGRGGAMSPSHGGGGVSGRGSPSLESLLGDDSIQRIIDKYTKELRTSLGSAGNFAVAPSPAETSPAAWRAALDLGEASSSVSLPWSRAQIAPEGRSPTSGPDLSSVPSNQETTTTPNVRRSSAGLYLEDTEGGFGKSGSMGPLEDFSKCSFEGAQNSSCHFLPLEPRPDFESSSSSSSRHSERQDQIRRAEASQVTGHLLDQSSPQYRAGRRDSALSRSIGDPSAQSTSHWLNDGRDVTTMQSFSPLVNDPASQSLGEWAELSEGQQSGSFEGARLAFMSDLERGGAAQPGQTSEPAAFGGASQLRPSSSHLGLDAQEATPPLSQASQRSVQDVVIDSGQELQDTGVFQAISSGDTLALDDPADGDTTLVDPTSDSFHPLPAEVTQNETSENSATFHLSEQDLHSPDGSDITPLTGAPSPVGTMEGVDPNSTLEPPSSPELLRAESRDPSLFPLPSPPDSLCVPAESRSGSHDSVLMETLATEDVTVAGLRLPVLPAPDALSLALPPEGARSGAPSAHPKGDEAPVLTGPEGLATRTADGKARPFWESILASSETGILEEPDLSLLNLTQSTTQELSVKEEEEGEEEEEEEETSAERKEPWCGEIRQSVSLEEDGVSSKNESLPSHAVMLQEFPWSPGNLQQAFLQKRQDFIQRSGRRLEELKARKEAMRNPVSRPQLPSLSRRPHNDDPQPQLLAGGGTLKKVGEVRVCTPEHRKTEEAQMYQRTERLYNRLEEVKQRKQIRSRQESYTKNREKAKEFQKKTLQKLRSKQARR